jgi:hypothetical protein
LNSHGTLKIHWTQYLDRISVALKTEGEMPVSQAYIAIVVLYMNIVYVEKIYIVYIEREAGEVQ